LIDLENRPNTPWSGTGVAISVLFPTLLGEAEFPHSAALNRDLAASLRARERGEDDHSAYTTVNHGWQSAPDVFDADVPAIHVLKQFIDQLWRRQSPVPRGAAEYRSPPDRSRRHPAPGPDRDREPGGVQAAWLSGVTSSSAGACPVRREE
jgi:hypothetical protein